MESTLKDTIFREEVCVADMVYLGPVMGASPGLLI